MELKIPREIEQTPKAMQHILGMISNLANSPGSFKAEFVEGEVSKWYSLEIISMAGQIRYFIRMEKKVRPLVEAAIFSYYPSVEVVEAEDYMLNLPSDGIDMEERNWDMWGQEIILKKPGIYPIKTYLSFDMDSEAKGFDPMSIFLELLSKLSGEEFLGIQILISPMSSKWADNFKEELDKIRGGKKGPDGEKKEKTSAETEIQKAVERNLGLPAFETIIRAIYMAPKPVFSDGFASKAVMSAFNQYGSYESNSFSGSKRISPRAKGWWYLPGPLSFVKERTLHRKGHLILRYRGREVLTRSPFGLFMSSSLFYRNKGSESSVLTSEGIATLFHPPTHRVLTAPHIKRVDSKKGGPPAGLAIFGTEDDISNFMRN